MCLQYLELFLLGLILAEIKQQKGVFCIILSPLYMDFGRKNVKISTSYI